MSAVTIAKMIQLQESKPISLPADFLETLRPKFSCDDPRPINKNYQDHPNKEP